MQHEIDKYKKIISSEESENELALYFKKIFSIEDNPYKIWKTI